MNKLAWASAVFAAVAIPCAAAAAASDLSMGESKPMGAGHVTSWVRHDAAGAPTAFGVAFDDAALTGLTEKDGEIAIAMPAAAGLPFRTAVVNWEPQGHPPAHVYDVPHFDFHFYTIDEKQRTAIGGAAPGTTPVPPAGLVAPGYITDGAAVPMMGVHYVLKTQPEFNGGTFTATPLYGYDGGHLAFVESMVTLAYLRQKPATDAPYAQPAKFEQPGLYPSHWSVGYDAATQRYVITFDRLAQHAAS